MVILYIAVRGEAAPVLGVALAGQKTFGSVLWSVFVFGVKRADRTNLLVWDQPGMVLVHKRLEGGKFVWPQVRDGVMRMHILILRRVPQFGEAGSGHSKRATHRRAAS